MEECKKKIQDVFDSIEVFKIEENINMTDDQIKFLEKERFNYFMKGYILSSIIEKQEL